MKDDQELLRALLDGCTQKTPTEDEQWAALLGCPIPPDTAEIEEDFSWLSMESYEG